jgi:hypothetical protein
LLLLAVALSSCKPAPPAAPRAPTRSTTWLLLVDTVRSEMGDAPRVKYDLDLVGRLRVFGDSTVAAILGFHCERGQLTALLTADYAFPEEGVRIRYDSEPAAVLPGAVAGTASGEGFVSFSQPAAMLRNAARSAQVLIEVANPPNDGYVARFDSRDGGPKADSILAACAPRR